MFNKEDQVLKQLMQLKDITNRTGCLHEAQVIQLKNWPMVLFPNLEECEIVPNTTKKNMEFNFKVSKTKQEPSKISKRYQALEQWVKALLGDDWKIQVLDNNIQMYGTGVKAAAKVKKTNDRSKTSKSKKRAKR